MERSIENTRGTDKIKWWFWVYLFTIAVFPWGTRYIFGQSHIVPGEWGITSIFVFEICAAAAVLGLILEMIKKIRMGGALKPGWPYIRLFFILMLAFFTYSYARGYFSIEPQVSFQWTRRAVLFFIFTASMFFLDKNQTKWVLRVILISAIPVFAFSFFQIFFQEVWGSTVLGIAAQNPALPGVSVVENSFLRFMRAYGSFPHPNILGGYSLIIWVFAWFALHFEDDSRLLFLGISILSIFGLVFSFSRSAWIGFVFAFILLWLISAFYSRRGNILFFSSLAQILILSIIFFPLIQTRIAAEERLEKKSIEERKEIFNASIKIFKKNYFFGVGAGVSPFFIMKNVKTGMENGINKFTAPAQFFSAPPHSVFLDFFVAHGILGALIVVLALYFFIKHLLDVVQHKNHKIFLTIPFLILAIPFVFDHFWISLPQGMFMALIFIFGFARFLAK